MVMVFVVQAKAYIIVEEEKNIQMLFDESYSL